jgi:predicted nucleic acid-binding protein
MTETADKLVVDASVMGAMFFQEPEGEFAKKRLSGSIWVVPVLLDYEMGSIFLKKLGRYPKLRAQLESCYQIFCESAIERVEIPVFSVIPIAEKFGLTIYDASYFWLASSLNVELFTFDKILCAAWAKRQ